MKKTIFVVVLLIGINGFVFSQIENWTSIGFEFGNSLEKYPDNGFSYLGAPGLYVNMYQFSNLKNFGLFVHFAALFPAVEKHDNIDYNYMFQYDWIMGPSFRHMINDNLSLRFGIGLHMTLPLYAEYTDETIDYTLDAVNLGIGADVGFKYDFTEKFYLDFGLTLAYDFINFVSIESHSNDGKVRTRVSDDVNKGNYILGGIKPYIGIGINKYGKKYKYGKPLRN
jgi:hypothetical protein